MRAVRIWFTKTGSAKFISHLDLMRYMTRELRKTGLDIYYTQGYNPRMHMVFALSLPLGYRDLTNCFDIKLLGSETNEQVSACLKSISSSEIVFTGISDPVHYPAEIKYAQYSVQFSPCKEELKNHIMSALTAQSLFCVKKNKKGFEKQLNLTEYVSNLSIDDSGQDFLLSFILPAGNIDNINPFLFLETLLKGSGQNISSANVVRKRLLIDKIKNYT